MIHHWLLWSEKDSKLKWALHRGQVLSLELCNLHRIWYSVISEFRFSAGINIVKMGHWDEDDPGIVAFQHLYRFLLQWYNGTGQQYVLFDFDYIVYLSIFLNKSHWF